MGDRRRETGDGRRETGDRRQKTGGGRRETGDGRGFYDVQCCRAGTLCFFSKVEPDTGTGFGSTLEKTKLILNDILVVHSIID